MANLTLLDADVNYDIDLEKLQSLADQVSMIFRSLAFLTLWRY